ncbi:hypothetical protein [Actinoplanes subtropicus]|uniref:hypothetical protein n=1 Tax=Actinoplanes subtropicus TaxID=543632 RepID=UPI0012F7AD43|nr:hypothetical protein [Actinoplanes subtropicus]
MPYKELRPSQVILDPENPRLPDGTSSDREAINQLLDEGDDALISLARDMAKTGQTNPAELPIAIKQGSKYLILEGNRRFAALKLLGDPMLADNEEYRAAFRRAALLGTPPKSVFTLIMTSREEAEHWIVLRHTGENNGRGVRRWSAPQTATHRRRANRPVDSGTIRSIVMADEVEEAYSQNDELTELIRQTRRGKLTNIGRFFSPEVLNRLHFSIEVDEDSPSRERMLLVRHSREQLEPFFRWAFTFIRDNSVDAYKNARIRETLLDGVPDLLPSDTEARRYPFRLAETAGTATSMSDQSAANVSSSPSTTSVNSGASPNPSSPPAPGSSTPAGSGQTATSGNGAPVGSVGRKHEAKPEKYLFHDLRLPNHPQRIQKVLKECRDLVIEDFSSVACVMARVVVELSVSSPEALRLSGTTESDSLKNKIIAMLKFLDPDIESNPKRDRELAQAFLEASELGIPYLNGFVHNPNVVPDPHLARRFSAAFRPMLERIDAQL